MKRGRPAIDVVAVLAAAAARLLPADELGPGAAEARVDRFFLQALADPRLGDATSILRAGAARLFAERFLLLDEAAQDAVVARFIDEEFMRILLVLTLEGFLADPKHGGNHDGIGWHLLGFSPQGRAR